ncbi:MAG: hypothetical protein NZL85_11350, partial [Fimbriimonadales bacterium]|nr:hypothetical protein [Fimbriimonadales bacterium]
SPVYLDYLRTVKRRGVKFRTVGKGYSLNPAPDCQLEISAPSQPFLRGTRSDANNASIIMRLRFGKVRVLFTGDIEREGRARLYRQGAELRAEVLKVAHHGSYNGTDMAFLNRVRPRIAVISCGFRNLYGHPHKEALQALQKAGAAIYRTDLQGDITLRIQGDRVQVFTARKASPPPSPPATALSFIGNRTSKVYHAPDCKALPKPQNRVSFRSREEAERAGYRPHHACIEN